MFWTAPVTPYFPRRPAVIDEMPVATAPGSDRKPKVFLYRNFAEDLRQTSVIIPRFPGMPLETGTKLGRYEIRSLIGVGGMGEVYLARDSKLDRDVALKLLPRELAADKDRLGRFVQEARAASSLNHPNIITIYEIEDSADPPYIAAEFIDGETLRDRLARGPMRQSEALEILIQCASALSAAHSAGIIHRDIKPENIMIRRDGYAKVLDFGLAKLSERQSSTVGSEAATRNFVRTDPGSVMGTVSYMSPEQSRGLEVDARTDLWSLGVVLYELVASRTPFAGDTATDVILAIVDKDPAPVSRYIPSAPEALEWIITKALTKDREERYQTAREMVTDLRRLKQRIEARSEIERSAAPESGGESFTKTQTQQLSTAPPTNAATLSSAEYIVRSVKTNKSAAFAFLVLGVILLAGGAWAVYRYTRAGESTVAGTMKISRLTSDGKAGSTAISPDGKYVVYSSGTDTERSLWVRQTATNSAVQILPGMPGTCLGTTFSADGNHIYYAWSSSQNADGALYEIPTLGGSARQILIGIEGPVSFSPDEKQIVFVRGEAQLMVAGADGSNERVLHQAKPETEWITQQGAAWSPDGQTIVFGKGNSIDGLDMELMRVSASGGDPIPFARFGQGEVHRAVWLKDGSGVIVVASERFDQGSQIWFVSYPDGITRRITNDLNGYGTFSLDITSDGSTLVTVQEDRSQQIWTAALGDDESRVKRITSNKFDGETEWLADGRIVFVRMIGGNLDLWIMNSDGSGEKQLTKDASLDYDIDTTPDGRYIVWTSDRSGLPHIWRMNIDGSDARQLTFGDTFDDGLPDITPDGKWVIYNSWKTGKWAPWKVSIDGGEPTLLFDGYAGVGAVAPDGKTFLASYLDERIRPAARRAAMMPVDGGPPVKIFDIDIPRDFASAGTAWSPDGKQIYYVSGPNIYSLPTAGGKARPATNFRTQTIFGFAATHDAKRFAVTRGEVTDDVILIKDFR